MRIGEVARLLSISKDTLRRWERQGLISPTRDWTNARRYQPEDVERLKVLCFRRAAPTKGIGSSHTGDFTHDRSS